MLHIPALRHGRPYRSMDVARAVHYKTREPFVEVSQANVGLIRRDLLKQEHARDVLAAFSTAQLIDICRRAKAHFLEDTLPLGDSAQSPDDYIRQLASTTGMPHALGRRNMAKIAAMMESMPTVLAGLTRGLDLSVLDHGYASGMSYYPRALSMGVVLPSNSPGVHSLWIPSIPLKTPLVLKPGSAEPWSPYRIIQAMLKAGCPPEAFCFFPTDHAGSGEILRSCGRGMLFGDLASLRGFTGATHIELHGPGYSKFVIGDDCVDEWPRYIEMMARSIYENGGRSCVNASGVWTTAYGDEIAAALAERLAQIAPRSEDDPRAEIAPFADPQVAHRLNGMVEQGLAEEGARDVCAAHRPSRLVEFDGCTFLLPTVIKCDSPDHPLANKEYLFPFASVVEVAQQDLPEILGPTLVVTAITRDPKLLQRLLASPHVGRINIGPAQTNQISWDQPHEGNLFDHLWARRAFQLAQEPVLQ